MTTPRLLTLSRLISTTATTTLARSLHRPTTTRLLRTLSVFNLPATTPSSASRSFSTRQSQNSMNDNNPNWSNRPPKETILLDGCDFEHWLVVMDPVQPDWTRDQIIDYYIQTLANVVGSPDEARMKIYSVSTKHYFAFGALVSEEVSNKLKEVANVRWVLPDSYLDVKNKDYGGEPFIDGQAVPYDPKYHEEWVRNNRNAMERNKRTNDRPRTNDRSRNFDRRQGPPPAGNMGGQPNQPPRGLPNQAGGGAPGFQPNAPPRNAGYPQGPPPPGYQPNMPPPGYQPNMPPPGYQPNNAGFQQPNMPRNGPGFPQNNMGGNFSGQGNPGYINNGPPNYQADTQHNFGPNGGMPNLNVPGRD